MNSLKKSIIKYTVIALGTFALLFAFNLSTNNQNNVQAATNWQKVAERGLSKSQVAARRWISFHESTNRYYARNGSCFGKFQLSIGYLHGNYSHKNQELTANRYVKNRYGTWTNAKHFWQTHHWY